MWPEPSVVSLRELREFYGIPDPLWGAFIETIGDPGEDMRVLAVIPPSVFRASATATALGGRRLTVVEGSQLGLLYRACRRNVHLKAGGTVENWVDLDPWNTTKPVEEKKEETTTTSPMRKLKFGSILDQQDEGEFVCETEEQRGVWYSNYVKKVGGMPEDHEDPSLEQVSALNKRLEMGLAPFVDFAIWSPYHKKISKFNKYQSFQLQEDGTFIARWVPGPASYAQWLGSFRVMRSAFLMLEVISLSGLLRWESFIERLHNRYPTCWHLIVEGENKARQDLMAKMNMKVRMDVDKGAMAPPGWTQARPWEVIWNMVLDNHEFWQEQVHVPALTWLAKGSKGTLKTPAEEIASSSLRGGMMALHPEKAETQDVEESPGKNSSRTRREARKKRRIADRTELAEWRSSKGGGKAGGGSKGGKSSGGEEECYAWNNNNGSCADLPPGEPCRGKKARLHRCTICKSPGHQSCKCPQKSKS